MREGFDGWHNSPVFCSLRQSLSEQRLCRLKHSQQLTAHVLANAQEQCKVSAVQPVLSGRLSWSEERRGACCSRQSYSYQ